MLHTLITNKTRLKILLKFFLNANTTSYLRDLEGEFGESTNAIRLELNRFEQAGLLQSNPSGNKKVFRANTAHPLFSDIHNIVLKTIGFDQVVDRVIRKLGGLQRAYLTGNFARGLDSRMIDLVLIGNGIDKQYLLNLIGKVENRINRKIRFVILEPEEASRHMQEHPEALLLWEIR
ncbi:MAG TPA: ArsR family transcriptional regulator [Bacteroidales bacterium]|nr:ArsR family transcriptional regulator [Bacteroidales bacterium]HSA42051.1 ArsR family transcriptional regulator [Bacteroidales bacterium]